jgi:hypothetical protein
MAARVEADGPLRLRQPRWHKIDSGVHLQSAAGHADVGLDARAELPAFPLGEPAYVPGVRIATRIRAF